MKKEHITYLSQELRIEEKEEIFTIPYVEIYAVVIDKPYVKVMTERHKYCISKGLHKFCSNLPEYFQQCNESVFVNLIYVRSIQKEMTGHIIYIGEKKYRISRRKFSGFRSAFQQMNPKLQQFGVCRICKKYKIENTKLPISI